MLKAGKRTAAVLGAVTLVGTAGLVALAPTASAAAVSYHIKCPVGIPGIPDADGSQDITFTMPSGKVKPGQTATIGVTMGPSPIALNMGPLDVDVSVAFDLKAGGGSSADVALQGESGKKLTITPNQPLQVPAFNATMTVPADATGDITLTPKKFTITAMGSINIVCTPDGDIPSLGTLPVDAAGPSVAVTPGTQEPGKDITLAGANWPAGTPTVELCKGTDCSADRFSAKSPVVGTDGKLSGTATLKADVADGDYTVKVTVGAASESAPLTVKKPQAATPAITLSPTSGQVGTEVTVNGTGFPAGAVSVSGVAGTAASSDTAVDATAAADGTFSAKFKVTDAKTTKIKAAGVQSSSAEAAFEVKAPVKDPNGKLVAVQYSCLTADSPIESAKGPFEATRKVLITLPSSADPNEKVDVSATFENDVVGDMPNIPVQVKLHITPEIDVKVTDDAGNTGALTLKADSPPDFDLVPGQPMKAGPFKGSFTVPGGGVFSFAPGELRIATVAMGATTHTVCTLKNTPEVSATLTAVGDRGELPQTSTGGTSTGSSSSTTGGDLAKTGSGGSAINAFALAAGTAVLAAVGVLLLVPYRRRLRTRA
ncbi:hypothetical protein ACPA54_09575 [Uniformispora flossi]|uniref:hypothetical protein n=1 Tax=Uniformispora flossi TaxID=3390723 RepID=UPI003C2BD745